MDVLNGLVIVDEASEALSGESIDGVVRVTDPHVSLEWSWGELQFSRKCWGVEPRRKCEREFSLHIAGNFYPVAVSGNGIYSPEGAECWISLHDGVYLAQNIRVRLLKGLAYSPKGSEQFYTLVIE